MKEKTLFSIFEHNFLFRLKDSALIILRGAGRGIWRTYFWNLLGLFLLILVTRTDK